ncbi:MAG: DUF4190 domain-containing protein [Clostridia bacterium]|nr:DUF4190 domain-containing protein [Clostridia bacterium]
MICPKCNSENKDDARFCVNCGESLAPQMPETQPEPQILPSPANANVSPQNVETPMQAAPVKVPSNGLSVAALVCGVIGIVGSFIPIVKYGTLVLAILGIVFGVLGRKKAVSSGSSSTGLATAGLVLGIIGTAFSAVGVICALACIGAADAAVNAGADAAKDAINSYGEAVTSAINEIGNAAKDTANEIAGYANEAATSFANEYASAVEDAANAYAEAVEEAGNAYAEAANDFVNSIFG